MRSTSFAIGFLLVVLVIVSATPCFSQNGNQFPPVPPFPNQTGPVDPDQERRAHELTKRANQERQAQLKRDADKLLKLATELKQYVDKSNENTLSLEVIQKAEQIERLAHSVREKMKGN